MAFLSFIKISSRQLILVRPALSCNVQYATFTSESSNVLSSAEPSRNESTVTPVFRVAECHIGRPALKDVHGLHTYGEVLTKSLKLAQKIRKKLGENRTQERIAFLCPNDVTYLIAQWACWAAGHIAVPLSPLHPPSVLSYYLEDSQTSLAITCDTLAEVLSSVTSELNPKIPVLSLDQSWREVTKVSESDPENSEDEEIKCDSVRIESANHINPELAALISETSMPESFFNKADAMILYTSGTTGKPKGVVLSHSNIESQVKSLIQAWAWSPADVILHTLPLHHTHGIVNALLCPLYVGARCIMMPKFDAGTVWSSLLGVNMSMCERPTIYMAVPTIYSKLIDEHEKKFGKNPRMSEYAKATCASKVRLMVSGSAPLPEPVFHKWHAITGHHLLERYGMTEIGMALSNPLEGERRPGHVGTPLPGVRVRLAEFKSSPMGSKGLYDIICEGNSKATRVSPGQAGKSGELLVTGPSVFQRYWNKPEATDKEFTKDGWFRTGDIAVYDKGYYKILGRASADIIKSGGYKISALEIETQLLSHPAISDCAVVGIPDPTWGQKVAAVVVVNSTTTENLPLDELKSWCRERMTPYSVPSEWKLVKSLPRNAMGKVNKKELVNEIFPTSP